MNADGVKLLPAVRSPWGLNLLTSLDADLPTTLISLVELFKQLHHAMIFMSLKDFLLLYALCYSVIAYYSFFLCIYI
jgi:hypothetical protein